MHTFLSNTQIIFGQKQVNLNTVGSAMPVRQCGNRETWGTNNRQHDEFSCFCPN